MSVRFVVQHHPSRANLLDRLISSAPDAYFAIVHDPDPRARKPQAWRTYRRCLEGPHGTSHVCVVQDDAVCVPGFADAAREAARARPSALIAFFHYAFPPDVPHYVRRALSSGEPFWTPPRGRYMPTVALLWPVEHARAFLRWFDTQKHYRPDFAGDDPVVGDWVGRHGIQCLVTAPSLVEHPDDTPSLLKKKAKRRTAVALAEHADDWLRILAASSSNVPA